MKSHITGKVARYLINRSLYCGVCAENIGMSFIEKKCFQPAAHKCGGAMCDPRSLLERSKAHPSGCIEWGRTRRWDGYGLKAAKCADGKWRPRQAHRLAWELERGPVPDGLYVMHKCDNKACVNVEHLELGTHQQNTRDAFARGLVNTARGEDHGNAKLTELQVREIKRSLPSESNTHLARLYNVTAVCVRNVRIGRTWKHVL